ncbi:hypothetical protein Vadar_014164 [Vaccinium darrowii]|uniref:Uncharacterized protein n=1 Tax=Vaccinium darrowii TaxID=229202 RepID=A0ACB7X9M2_9ERIC|nr:hypothetical protein Vadar_014164 [Vaccinium darrowii]
MGVSCDGKGKLTITDDDVIQKSNGRQFLFHDLNVGQAKSTVAASAAVAINPNFHAEALQNRVSPETENVFDDTFWENLSVVVNVLDNVNSRLCVDKRCLYFRKPLLESGKHGAKCNTRMVIPHLIENYGAPSDPPEKKAPMCTVRSFPHNIDRCLTWARSEFEGLLEKTPIVVNAFLSNPNVEDSIDDEASIKELIVKLEQCRDNLQPEFRMKQIQFNKMQDDDTIYHMDLIAGLANMRARNYSIPEVDKLKAKVIAGRIIPAIATSTAMATGLVYLELYKVLDGHTKWRTTGTPLPTWHFLYSQWRSQSRLKS